MEQTPGDSGGQRSLAWYSPWVTSEQWFARHSLVFTKGTAIRKGRLRSYSAGYWGREAFKQLSYTRQKCWIHWVNYVEAFNKSSQSNLARLNIEFPVKSASQIIFGINISHLLHGTYLYYSLLIQILNLTRYPYFSLLLFASMFCLFLKSDNFIIQSRKIRKTPQMWHVT